MDENNKNIDNVSNAHDLQQFSDPTGGEDPNQGDNLKNVSRKIIIVVGAIILIIIGVWGVVKLVPLAISSITNGSLFKPSEKIVLTTNPHDIQSGQPFTLSWEHVAKPVGQGIYAFSYPCKDNFNFKISSDPKAPVLPCATTVRLNATSSLPLVALSTKERSLDIPVSIQYLPADVKLPTVQGDTTITVTNPQIPDTSDTTGDIATSTSTTDTVTPDVNPIATSTKTTYSSGSKSTKRYGKADLAIYLMSTGILDKSTGQFIATKVISSTDRPAVKFKVINEGGSPSGVWDFSTILPTTDHKIFTSPAEISLKTGELIEFTLGFDNPALTGQNSVLISVDEGNQVSESRKDNNILQVSMGGGTMSATPVNYTNTYSNNYNYTNTINTVNNGGYTTNSSTGVDLAVRVLATGTIDRYSGQFNPSPSVIVVGQKVGVQLEVTNIGTTPSGQWVYNASFPSTSPYHSPAQYSLNPGQRVVILVSYDASSGGQNVVTVNVIPSSSTFESRTDNNVANAYIPVSR